MSAQDRTRPFVHRAAFDRPELVGARWWQEGLLVAADPVTRRSALVRIALAAGGLAGLGLAAGGAVAIFGGRRRQSPDPDPGSGTAFDERTITGRALDLQRERGWNVGHPQEALGFPSAAQSDVDGAPVASAPGSDLAARLAPAQERLAPYNVPTLFQTLAAPANKGLFDTVKPVFSPAMQAAYDRGRAVVSLFEATGWPADTALLADLPGPEAVAFAAGVSGTFEPVFTFDNWPHPRGVVPAHLALGAALYYLPLFERAAKERSAGAPPVFVLDRDRLAAYTDDGTRFDNRYLAKLPPAERWKDLGVKHLLYVIPEGAPLRELDDLNDDFTGLKDEDVDVRILALGDLLKSDEPPPPTPVEKTDEKEPTRGHVPAVHHHYWYGGSPSSHWWFWRHYGWHPLPPAYTPVAPSRTTDAHAWTPSPRSTLYSSGVPGGVVPGRRTQPRGFGMVTIRTPAPGSGGGGGSGSSGRSGSFGRTWGTSGG
jgi:hypothetical protein